VSVLLRAPSRVPHHHTNPSSHSQYAYLTATDSAEWRDQCYCGDRLTVISQMSESECNLPCAGDGSIMCGGFRALSLFSTKGHSPLGEPAAPVSSSTPISTIPPAVVTTPPPAPPASSPTSPMVITSSAPAPAPAPPPSSVSSVAPPLSSTLNSAPTMSSPPDSSKDPSSSQPLLVLSPTSSGPLALSAYTLAPSVIFASSFINSTNAGTTVTQTKVVIPQMGTVGTVMAGAQSTNPVFRDGSQAVVYGVVSDML
jgi:hypothetical protein